MTLCKVPAGAMRALARLTGAWLAVVCTVAPLMAQGAAGPLRPSPRPPGAAPQRMLPMPRTGQQEGERDTFRYVPPADHQLAKAIEANLDFQQELPDFVCRERMTRFSSRNLGTSWTQEDVVEAEILTIGDQVEYRDIKIDGRPSGAADMSQIGGAWSFGEYRGVVSSLFSSRSRAKFTKRGPVQLGDRDALVYDYQIEEAYSHWTLSVSGSKTIPAYHGKVWIDSETGRALRIETEAAYLPLYFPLSSAGGVLEYDEVEVDGQSYLLPARAENSSCERGSAFCTQLIIEFLEYRKFSAESTLFTTDSTIVFGGEGAAATEPSK